MCVTEGFLFVGNSLLFILMKLHDGTHENNLYGKYYRDESSIVMRIVFGEPKIHFRSERN